jgi:sarcosine oxidase subunit beta
MSSQNNEYVIVGGGIYGASLAYQLASAGKSVLLLEAGEVACGASGGPGERGVRANRRDPRELPVAAVAMALWQKYQAAFVNGVGYRRIGGLQVFDVPYGYREHEVRGQMEAMAALQSRLGAPSELLDAQQAWEKEPELTRSLIGAIFCPDDGVCDHTFATQQFAAEAVRAGATLRTDARVSEILAEGGRATGVKLASGEVIRVEGELILTANAGTQALLAPYLTEAEQAPTWFLMPQMIYVTNPLEKQINHLLSHAHRKLAVKQIVDGTLMLSGGASVSYTPEGLWKGSLSSTANNLTDAIAAFPFIDHSSFVKADASRVETVCIDGIPVVDKPAALTNTLYGYGWSGHGFAISHGITLFMSEWLLSGERPDALQPFASSRFQSPLQSVSAALNALRN